VTDLIGTTIGNYRIESLLGAGGMGQVYLGVHLHLNRPAAVKIMHAHLADEESFKRRFRQEARAVAALNHPHIVQTWDFGSQDGNFYLVMELLTDGSLRSLSGSDEAQQPGWNIHVGLDLVRQAAEGLAYAHNRGMVHRDIKPDNLLLHRLPDDLGDGPHDLSLKITDFGLARMTEEASATGPSLVMGTPAYMSPELCQGLPVDRRSDIYSLGVVLYQVVTGRLPFETRAAAEAAYKHVHATPPSPREYWPDIPPSLEDVILRCLAKEPDERFTSSAELVRALRAVHEELAPIAPAPPAPTDGGSHHYRTPSPLPAVRPLPTPRSAAVAHVVVSAGNGGGARQVVELGLDGLIVGSLPDNDLVLGDDAVYGRHLRIDWDGEQAFVTDLGSSSGTSLGIVPLAPHMVQPWDAADELRIGTRSLRLMLPASATVDPAGQTVATPVPVVPAVAGGALAGVHANDATMSVGKHNPVAPTQPSRWRRLPVLATAAVIAVLLSVGGLQALSFGGGGGGPNEAASLADAGDQSATPASAVAVVAESTETPAATETSAPNATNTPEPTSTATITPIVTGTPSPQPTDTPAPTATEPPPPAPANTPVPPTATPPPAETPTPVPPEATPSPEPTTPPEATAPPEATTAPEPEATTEPGEDPAEEPTAPAEPTPESGDASDPAATTGTEPGSSPAPTGTAGG
jgi:serine/threonine protein kinase/pSer/pThr/pTyr-binding forkhead associated (FHA) protein